MSSDYLPLDLIASSRIPTKWPWCTRSSTMNI